VARNQDVYGSVGPARLAINRSRLRIPAAALPSATLGKLFIHTCASITKQYNWYRQMAGELTTGLQESNGSLLPVPVYGLGHLRADCRGPV